MSILFFVLGSELLASSRTRVYQHLPYFREENIAYRIFILEPNSNSSYKNWIHSVLYRTYIHGRMLLFLFLALFYKRIFLQKTILPKWIIFCLFVLKKKLIFDFDDAIYTTSDQSRLLKSRVHRLDYLLKKSSLVIIENDQTETYAKQFCANVLRITGPIDCKKYKPLAHQKSSNAVTIGWIGSGATTPYLLLIQDVFKKLKAIYGKRISFVTIGAEENLIKHLPIQNHRWRLDTEVNLLSSFDIGIMPLPDDEWAKGKGGYKLLQYMAIGIPSVASPVGVNVEIVGDNCGMTASTTDEWIKQLDRLINDSTLRYSMGLNARSRAENNYSFEVNSLLLIEYIRKI